MRRYIALYPVSIRYRYPILALQGFNTILFVDWDTLNEDYAESF
jgi:hypothetical protein